MFIFHVNVYSPPIPCPISPFFFSIHDLKLKTNEFVYDGMICFPLNPYHWHVFLFTVYPPRLALVSACIIFEYPLWVEYPFLCAADCWNSSRRFYRPGVQQTVANRYTPPWSWAIHCGVCSFPANRIGKLTHCPSKDVPVIQKVWISHTSSRKETCALAVKLYSAECHRKSITGYLKLVQIMAVLMSFSEPMRPQIYHQVSNIRRTLEAIKLLITQM